MYYIPILHHYMILYVYLNGIMSISWCMSTTPIVAILPTGNLMMHACEGAPGAAGPKGASPGVGDLNRGLRLSKQISICLCIYIYIYMYV